MRDFWYSSMSALGIRSIAREAMEAQALRGEPSQGNITVQKLVHNRMHTVPNSPSSPQRQ